MKVKRFFAKSMAEALKQVSEQMGPDAVILSNRRVDGGVEIVTALDYDENMARQRLGNRAEAATNGSRLAELQADQHRRLEDELSRSRDRIREVREKRASQGAGYAKASFAGTPEAVGPASSDRPNSASAGGESYSDELARMRAEISSLRDLMQGRKPGAAPEPSATSAVQQRLAERLQEFGLGAELAASIARRHKAGRLEDGWKQSLKMLCTGVRTARMEWLDQGGRLRPGWPHRVGQDHHHRQARRTLCAETWRGLGRPGYHRPVPGCGARAAVCLRAYPQCAGAGGG